MSRTALQDYSAVKRPNQTERFDQQQFLDMSDSINDPLFFLSKFLRIQHPTQGAIPFTPYPFQERIINAFHNHKYTVALCARQTGKTTCAAGYLLWRAMFVPDSTILITANKFAQALEIMARVRYGYENMPDYIRAGVVEYNKAAISFDNGSRIIARATSPDAGRGLAISLVYMDEFAMVPSNMATEFFTSMQPVIATGGDCIITSTPKNDEDMFAKIWKGAIDNTDEYGNKLNPDGVGRNFFYAIKVPWWEHPERDEAWAKPWRESLGDARFRQEFACDFLADESTLIDPQCLGRLNGQVPIYYTGTTRWYREPEPNRSYLVALDPSVGTGRDHAAIQVFQLPHMVQVAEWQHNHTPPRGQVLVLLQTLVYLDAVLREHPQQLGTPELFWTFENNTIGEAILTVIEDTGEDRFPGTLLSERRQPGLSRRFRRGLLTTNRNKLSGCARLKSLLESGRMTIHSANLIHELKNFVALETTFKAAPGETDDLVMATVLVTRMLDIVLAWGTAGGAGELREQIVDAELVDEGALVEPMPVVL